MPSRRSQVAERLDVQAIKNRMKMAAAAALKYAQTLHQSQPSVPPNNPDLPTVASLPTSVTQPDNSTDICALLQKGLQAFIGRGSEDANHGLQGDASSTGKNPGIDRDHKSGVLS